MIRELLVPPYEIKNERDLMRWHDELLELALELELNGRLIEDSLRKISNLKKVL